MVLAGRTDDSPVMMSKTLCINVSLSGSCVMLYYGTTCYHCSENHPGDPTSYDCAASTKDASQQHRAVQTGRSGWGAQFTARSTLHVTHVTAGTPGESAVVVPNPLSIFEGPRLVLINAALACCRVAGFVAKKSRGAWTHGRTQQVAFFGGRRGELRASAMADLKASTP